MANPPVIRLFIITMLVTVSLSLVCAQERTVSFGVFTGITSTYTWDEGIDFDPRYTARYNIKFAPVGFNFGVDYEGYGFVISPGLFTTGQDYNMLNSEGGNEGRREIDLHYINIPIAFKFHVIDLDFLKTSFIFGGGPAYLIGGNERVSHHAAKFYFPPVVYPNLPDTYSVEYDGVLAPEVEHLAILQKKDFKPWQLFGFVGARADWYFSDKWKASFDFRVNYTFSDNRSEEYIGKLNTYQTLYDMPGKRRDFVASLTFGVSRYIEIDATDKNHHKVLYKSNTKKYVAPRNTRKRNND
jgi:hypothetical protein